MIVLFLVRTMHRVKGLHGLIDSCEIESEIMTDYDTDYLCDGRCMFFH